ncbi:MAG: flagellar basal-body rod protein FlgF [Devosia sp.]|nr:flagellar basal-body rod protein FlgF [Devosia sp.]
MENAQLVSLSRQIALQRQLDVVSNNVANLNTTGFKAESILFQQYDMPTARDNDFSGSQSVAFTQDWATIHDMANGALEQTGNPLDVGLTGPGFLTVSTAAGPRYTRSGSLAINAAGTLVDLAGNPVLGSDGTPFQFDAADTDVTILKDGTITTSQGAKGKLGLVEFADPQQAQREGNNLWSGSNPAPATTTQVVQGSIERSNVSGVTEMASLIRVQRAYEQLATIMQRQDDLRSNAVQKLGSVAA